MSTKSYAGLDSKKNYISYGSVGISGTSITTNTFKPAQISYPASLTAGKSYTSTVTETSVNTGASIPIPTTTLTEKETAKLVSEKLASVKVPAGTFNAYQLIVTSTITQTGQTSSTTTTFWFAPSKGLVKTSTGTGATATSLQLIK